jgi:serine/threonine-protein kinase
MARVQGEADFEGEFLVGTTLCDKWRVVRQLGRGGMSTVYEAEDPAGGRVAVKVLHESLAKSPRTRERFLREGRLLNAVRHDDAVRMLDSREASDGRMLLVMELLDGQTLRRTCESSGGKLDAAEVLRIGQSVLGVLSAAHAKGIVHRDIKPENIFLTTDGRVKVLDFGVAAIRDEALQDASITQSGASLGTPAFMAPEQARGRQSQVDARTDIWALGATLFYCLTGRHVHQDAFTANEALIFAATQPVSPLRRFRPELAAEIGPIIDRALAFDPANRWQSADAMRDAIIAAARHRRDGVALPYDLPNLQGTDTLEHPPPSSRRTARPRATWLLAVAVVVLMGAALVKQVNSAQDARTDMAHEESAARIAVRSPTPREEATESEAPVSPVGTLQEGAAEPASQSRSPAAGSPAAARREKRSNAATPLSRPSRAPTSDDIPESVLNRRK